MGFFVFWNSPTLITAATFPGQETEPCTRPAGQATTGPVMNHRKATSKGR